MATILYECMLNDNQVLVLTEEQMENYAPELSDGSLVVLEILDPDNMEEEEYTAILPGVGSITLTSSQWEQDYPELYHSGELEKYMTDE